MPPETLEQNYADASGFIVDRTVDPPKVLGQAFLISKSRAVTCASSIFNYAEAPWALGLNFVHPDVMDGVKAVTLHNDFDKFAARKWYLAQTGTPGDQLCLPNDMASITLEFQKADLMPDKVVELHRALSLPFLSDGVEASGNVRGSEFITVLKSALESKREGLITLLDRLNIPIARIALGPGVIQKVYFRGMLGELAFFELIHRKPAEGYMFQPVTNFNWGNVRDITAPTDALMEEAERRDKELPQMFAYLGGADSRYQQRVEVVEPGSVTEEIEWVVERLWPSIDGYMTIDNLPERAGVDTYSALHSMRELVNRGLISMINRPTPFHCNGQVGAPLLSHTDFEIHAWDPLQSFYLDPLSGKPSWQNGNFFGVGNALQPKNMLHTIPLPDKVPGALILKDYKLIGLHSGPHVPKPGSPTPPVKLYQFMWMGALLDLSSRKPKMDEQAATGGFSNLRSKMDDKIEDASDAGVPEKLEKHVCPTCFTTNTQVGPCFNCGTVIEPPPPEAAPEGPAVVHKFKQLQEKHGVTKFHMIVAAVTVVGVLICGTTIWSTFIKPHPVTPANIIHKAEEHKTSVNAVNIATRYAGFKGTAPPGYWFVDTSDLTKSDSNIKVLSFGLQSDTSNQDILFVIMDSMAPVNDLKNFLVKPPYANTLQCLKAVDQNSQILGSGNLTWAVNLYEQAPEKDKDGNEIPSVRINRLVGAFPSPMPGKSVLVLGRGLDPDPSRTYDYRSTLWLCDQMAADYTARGNTSRDGSTTDATKVAEGTKTDATDDEVDDWVAELQPLIQAKVELPDDLQEALDKKKKVKIKSGLRVTISEDGSITKLEITEPSDNDSINNALTKAVNAVVPYNKVPHTKEGSITVVVKLNADKIRTKRQTIL